MTDLDLLENDLIDAITMREKALVKGNVASWEEFKYLTGVVAGLKGALDAVNEAQRRYEDA